MSDGNGIDEVKAQVAVLGVVTARQASTATALHESIVAVRPYAVGMRWLPVLMIANFLGLMTNGALLYAILLSLLKR